ncbi:MAG: hypothetical protein J5506_01040 [Prevotella sp.]|nr:hypothetical protein [Prevotella sp.]
MNTISKFISTTALVLAVSGPLSGCADSMKKGANAQEVTGISDALTGNENGAQANANNGDARLIDVSIDESGLSKTTVKVGDGEFDYYQYDNAAVGKVKVTLSALPRTLAELKALHLPKGMNDLHDTPYLAPALMAASVSQYFVDKDECKRMINYIGKKYKDISTGAADFYASDWGQLGQYNEKYMQAVRSYFNGATRANGYTPSEPVTMEMELNKYSYTADENCIQLWIKSSVKSSKQEFKIWMLDQDGDGRYDYFYPTTFMTLAHGLGEY